jgi:hypothetical protein
MSSSFENKHYCPGIFLDVAQAFDRAVCQTLLTLQNKITFPASLYLLIRSYFENRTFKVRHGNYFRQKTNLESSPQIQKKVIKHPIPLITPYIKVQTSSP